MSRYVNPAPQIEDLNGKPIVGAKKFLFEPGTVIKKTVYSDSGFGTPQANPVLSLGSGIFPAIFLDGIYDEEQQDNSGTATGYDGVTLWTREDIGGAAEGQFELWLNDNTYNIPDIVLGSDDEYYQSIQDGNQGNDPTISPAFWNQVKIIGLWHTDISYSADDIVIRTGKLYSSLTNSNGGNDPVTDSVNWESATPQKSKLESITATVASSALTVTLNPTILDFRSDTLTDGTPATRAVGSAISLVAPTGATFGTSNNIKSRLMILAIDNAGTVELAMTNVSGGLALDEANVISTTAISGSSTSPTIIYSETSRTDVSYKIVGFIDSTQATAGTWATDPSLKQGVGGNELIGAPPKSTVRVHTANGYGSTNDKIRRFTVIIEDIGSGIVYADSATLGGTFTINAEGVYAMSYTDAFSSGGDMGISLNSTQLTTSVLSITTADKVCTGSTSAASFGTTMGATIYLNPGDVIRAHTGGSASAGAAALFTITRAH